MLRRILRQAFKPLHRLYYRFAFGRRLPLAAPLARLVAAGERLGGYGDVPLARQTWEQQYQAGQWELLAGLDEVARYAVIAAYVHQLRPRPAVLDVGCGEGLLRHYLEPRGYRRYLGVDLAAAAIDTARAEAGPDDAFAVADAATFTPDEAADAIVLNEVLYYFPDPLAVARRYFELLPPEGLMVVSMFRSPRTDAIARRLARHLPQRLESRISGRHGSWTVAVFSQQTSA